MKNLIYKEFKLSIHPLFSLVPLLSALILIPHWLYFIAMSYVFFITISNIFTSSNAQRDIEFSVMLPVKKEDIVKSRFISIMFVELVQIATAIIFAVLNYYLYPDGNMFMEPNAAFFGFVLIMYALFNAIFLPMFYKTGHKVGLPAILATLIAIIFAAIVEVSVLLIPALNMAFDSRNSDMLIYKLILLGLGIVIYFATGIIAYKVSAKRFEAIDI